jgi:hypothetical protein
MGFLLRWGFAFGLLAATYNPTAWNYVRWAEANWPDQTPLAVLIGLVLLTVYIVFLTAILRGIGALGAILVVAVAAALVWVLWDYGWLDLQDPTANTWIAIVALSLVLAVGIYWGIVWRRLTGQVEVDDDDA